MSRRGDFLGKKSKKIKNPGKIAPPGRGAMTASGIILSSQRLTPIPIAKNPPLRTGGTAGWYAGTITADQHRNAMCLYFCDDRVATKLPGKTPPWPVAVKIHGIISIRSQQTCQDPRKIPPSQRATERRCKMISSQPREENTSPKNPPSPKQR